MNVVNAAGEKEEDPFAHYQSKTLCCICLSVHPGEFLISTRESAYKDEKLSNLLCMLLKDGAFFPANCYMCSDCYRKLKMCYNFVLLLRIGHRTVWGYEQKIKGEEPSPLLPSVSIIKRRASEDPMRVYPNKNKKQKLAAGEIEVIDLLDDSSSDLEEIPISIVRPTVLVTLNENVPKNTTNHNNNNNNKAFINNTKSNDNVNNVVEVSNNSQVPISPPPPKENTNRASNGGEVVIQQVVVLSNNEEQGERVWSCQTELSSECNNATEQSEMWSAEAELSLFDYDNIPTPFGGVTLNQSVAAVNDEELTQMWSCEAELSVDDKTNIIAASRSQGQLQQLEPDIINNYGNAKQQPDENDSDSDTLSDIELKVEIDDDASRDFAASFPNSNKELARCNHCGYQTIFEQIMNVHKVTRSHFDSLTCKLCNRLFVTAVEYLQHQCVNAVAKTRMKFTRCTICNVNFALNDYRTHMKTHNTELKGAVKKCGICGKACRLSSTLNTHIAKFHPVGF